MSRHREVTVYTDKSDGWHLGFLDALRGIAVLGVVMAHSGQGLLLHRLDAVTFSGQRGVQLFFIVSAFTLFLSHDNRKNEVHPTLNFFLRRFFRLAPMFYLATALVCILYPALAGPRSDVALSLIFLHGITVHSIMHGALGGWSVADEAIFYMVLPFLLWKIRNLTTALWVLMIAAPVLYFATQAVAHGSSVEVGEYATFLGFPVEFPIFIMGASAYFFWKDYIPSRTFGSKSTSLLVLASAAALYCINLPFNDRHLYATSFVCVILLIGLAIYPWPLLVNPFTRLLGKVSFSVYLLHFYPLLEIRKLEQNPAFQRLPPAIQLSATFLAVSIITVPLSFLAWKWVERPGILIGKRVIAALENRAITRNSTASPYTC